MAEMKTAKFQIGQVVRHRVYSFRGVVFDVDPEFANSEEWYDSIPEDVRPRRDQPSIISLPKMTKPSMSPMSPSRICSRTALASLSGTRRCVSSSRA